MGKRGPRTDLIPINCILGNLEVRSLCSGRRAKPVTRETLQRWRKTRRFPKPIRELASGELWDRRAVKAWLNEQK